MPQTLPPDGWQISEENHERYLHTLGNLSITFDNQGLGNKAFAEKKTMLLKQSRITLNQMLSDYEVFDEKAICDRSLKLLDMFAAAYGLKIEPDVEVFDAIDDSEINIFLAGDPTDKKLEYAMFCDVKIQTQTVTALYVEIFKRLFKLNAGLLFSAEIVDQIKLTNDKKRLKDPGDIEGGYLIEKTLIIVKN